MVSHTGKGRHSGGKKRLPTPVIVALAVVASCIVAVVVGVFALCAVWLQDLPDYTDADAFNTNQPTEVYANDRTTLLARFQLENRDPLDSLDQAGSYAVEATVATEDERFYDHGGVDPIGIARALMNNVTGGSLEGASTITQQTVRNTILVDEATDISLKRKVREAWLALKMEEYYSKDEILLIYMNTINYGSGSYGIEAAAKRYYSKSAADLTLNEAATLAGIPQSPTYNNPIDNPDQALVRRNIVLDRMLGNGYITQEEHDAVLAEPIELNPSTPSNDGILLYPYFSSYVRDQLTSTYELSTSEVFKGGLTVYTTLDLSMQQAAEVAAANKEATVPESLEVALTAIDPDNGYIKAMVGGKDYYSETSGQWNLATQSQRPAGSSFKTFTLVAALEQGISPETMVNCSTSVTIENGTQPWKVSNIYNIDYGTRSIARAFAVSSNTGFARIIKAVGPAAVVDAAHRMGIESELREELSLTLGTSEVTTLEMADAYATVANGGTHYDAVAIEQVLDRKGDVLVDNSNPEGERAISPEVAHAATEVMKGVVNSSEGTGKAAALSNGQVVAGKTGTSEDYLDSWFCGITPQLSVAIWMGDRSNQVSVPQNISSASVFADFVGAVLEGQPTEDFPAAGDPAYTKTFTNSNLDVQGVYSSGSYDDESSDESSTDTAVTPTEPTVTPTEPEVAPTPEPEPEPTPTPTPTPTPDPEPAPEPEPTPDP